MGTLNLRKKNLVVVSLFDGLSGARLALEQVPHLNVLRYYSAEIDKYAIKVADANHPQDTAYRLGSVTEIDGIALKAEIERDFGDVGVLLVGGSPCQGFSLAGKLKGSSTACGIDVVTLEQYLELKEQDFEFDGQSYLFWEYIRLRDEIKPKYWFLENVRVIKKWKTMFDDAMGVEAFFLNSNLVSAQNRPRYYWHNFGKIELPDDERKNLKIADILEDTSFMDPVIMQSPRGFNKGGIKALDGKSPVITKSCWHENNKLTERPCVKKEFDNNSVCHHAATATDINGHDSIKRVYGETGKSPTVSTCQSGNSEPKVLVNKILNVNPSGNGMNGNVYGTDGKSPTVTTNKGEGSKVSSDAGARYRKLTPLECERLQCIPDNYTNHVSNSQRYKMIGNGFTIAAVAYLFEHIGQEVVSEPRQTNIFDFMKC